MINALVSHMTFDMIQRETYICDDMAMFILGSENVRIHHIQMSFNKWCPTRNDQVDANFYELDGHSLSILALKRST